jgi:hypothetical protein
MKLQILRLPLIIAVLALGFTASNAIAQIDFRVAAITAHDAGTGVGTDTFGVHINATYCIDGVLSPGGFTEEELPPKPPAGVFDLRFTDHRSSSGCTGPAARGGGQRVDLQEDAGKLDTFKIEFQPGDGGYPFTFSWSSALGDDWDNLVIQDAFGGFFVNVNMLTDSSVTVTNGAITSLNIIGAAKVLAVEREGNLVPQRFALEQNYPNPFNPSTTIKFSIEKTAFTDVAVYNVIGQKVKTLAAEVLNPGFYTTTWNGTDDNGQSVTTGVYFVRMVANGDNAQFSDLRKLLLMK